MITRTRMHKPLFSPDRNHIHHRLMDAGCTQHQALGVILSLDLCFVALNSLLVWTGVQPTIIFAADIAMFVGFIQLVKRRET